MNDTELTEALERLIRTTSDSDAAFHAAAAVVRGDEVRALLLDRAYRFTRAAAALRAVARANGVTIAAPPPADAAWRPDADDSTILAEGERREDRVIVAYRDALELSLPAAVRRTVEQEFDSLLASLGSLRALRDRLARQSQRHRLEQPM